MERTLTDLSAEIEGISKTLALLCKETAPGTEETPAPILIHSSLYSLSQHLNRIANDLDSIRQE